MRDGQVAGPAHPPAETHWCEGRQADRPWAKETCAVCRVRAADPPEQETPKPEEWTMCPRHGLYCGRENVEEHVISSRSRCKQSSAPPAHGGGD